MKRRTIIAAVVGLALAGGVALAQVITGNEFATQTAGKTVMGFLPMWLNGTNKALPTSDTSPLPTTLATNVPTYRAADTNIANVGAGDIFCLYGSASKVVQIRELHASGTTNTALVASVSVIKRSAVWTNGTPVAETAVPNSSTNLPATATATGYSASPSTGGTAVGSVGAHKIAVGTQGNSANETEAEFLFGRLSDQPLTLNSASEGACINVSAAGTGASWAVYASWTEK